MAWDGTWATIYDPDHYTPSIDCCMSADDSKVYVATWGEDSIVRIDAATGVMDMFRNTLTDYGIQGGDSICLSPDGLYLYVTFIGDGSSPTTTGYIVGKFLASDLSLVADTGGANSFFSPFDAVLNSDGSILYVTRTAYGDSSHPPSSQIVALDTSDMSVIDTIDVLLNNDIANPTVNADCRYIAITPDDAYLLVSCFRYSGFVGAGVHRYGTVGGLSRQGVFMSGALWPNDLGVLADGSKAYVTQWATAGTVEVFDPATLTAITTITGLDNFPKMLSVAPDGVTVIAISTTYPTAKMYVIDSATDTIVDTFVVTVGSGGVAAGGANAGMAIPAAMDKIFVAGFIDSMWVMPEPPPPPVIPFGVVSVSGVSFR